MHYYNEEDLARFGEIGKSRPDLFEKFMAWYQACQEEGALTKREKALIGLAVAVTVQCPYCIDAYTQSSLENGSNTEQMTEAIHLASAIRGRGNFLTATLTRCLKFPSQSEFRRRFSILRPTFFLDAK